MGGLGSNTKLGGVQFRRCLRNFILGAGDHVPVEKAASVSDCGAKLLTKNCTADLLKPQKFAEQNFSNDSAMSVIDNLDSIITSMIEDSENITTTDISLDLPQDEDEIEDMTDLTDKDKNSKQRKFLTSSLTFCFKFDNDVLFC